MLIVFDTGSVAAQTSPESTLRSFFAAVAARNWSAAADYVDPSASAYSQTSNMWSLVSWARAGAPTAAKAGNRPGGGISFSGVRDTSLFSAYDTVSVPGLESLLTLGSLRRMSPSAFMMQLLSARYRRVGPGVEYRLLGTVFEQDSVAHVLYRIAWKVPVGELDEPLKVEIAHLRHVGDRWLIALSPSVWTNSELINTALNARAP